MSRLLLERHVFQLNFYLIFLFKDFSNFLLSASYFSNLTSWKQQTLKTLKCFLINHVLKEYIKILLSSNVSHEITKNVRN